MNGFFVTATDTEVGKTLVTGGLAGALRKKGLDIGVYKPVQSGHLTHQPEGDAARLKRLSGVDDPLEEICPYSFSEPVAPRLAIQRSQKQVRSHDVIAGYERLKRKHRYLLVEGAGGIAVPYVEDALVVDIAKTLALPLLVVARPDLGTVNHTVLTIEYARSRGLQVAGVILSGCGRRQPISLSESHNPGMIEELANVRVLGKVPWLGDRPDESRIVEAIEEHVDLKSIQEVLIGGEKE
ncbi:ATP-dependent dethiobiotin synthetase BioD [Collibacillus ludicampi]|uniref:ATP-dependent dethiobiotin synthetase BioD n=1 Tax=Collibacillus ludicampi TaxID=2771369 RepID=A0AAV4LGB3_9BACL|nr:dethiobiotin synthase [Collibacillus ludicampi]GIM46876.1 ATP-dependent dethiobiotin synthetase BioD [Collibacillus ludicampi]